MDCLLCLFFLYFQIVGAFSIPPIFFRMRPQQCPTPPGFGDFLLEKLNGDVPLETLVSPSPTPMVYYRRKRSNRVGIWVHKSMPKLHFPKIIHFTVQSCSRIKTSVLFLKDLNSMYMRPLPLQFSQMPYIHALDTKSCPSQMFHCILCRCSASSHCGCSSSHQETLRRVQQR